MAGTKRKATTQAEPLSSPGSRRQSGRAKKVQVVYAESDAEDVASDDEFDDAAAKSESEAEIDEPSEVDDYSDADSEVETKGKGKGKGKGNPQGNGMKSSLQGWKKTVTSNGVEQMVIDIPGKKDPGDTPYADGRIHPNTLQFLRELKRNNKREWLKFHDAPFRYATLDPRRYCKESLLTIPLKDKQRKTSRPLSKNWAIKSAR